MHPLLLMSIISQAELPASVQCGEVHFAKFGNEKGNLPFLPKLLDNFT
jgi:hypothetical protein